MSSDNGHDENYDDDFDQEVSKSELKREMLRYQVLGEKLCELPTNRWPKLPISETLRIAMEESRRITKHEARRRHFQYIGKVMRNEDIDAINIALDMMDPSSELYGRRIRQQELWRTRLVERSEALNEFIEEYPFIDRQILRNLVRNAQKEMQQTPPKPGTNYKKLFQLIRQTVSAED